MRKTVTVFGSSKPIPGEKEYEDAYTLGKLLGASGFNVCSGGYQGIMDAVSKGVTESGGIAIGITVDTFFSKPSIYLTEEIKCSTLFERITNLVQKADAFIILPGGTGTLLELAAVWEFVNKGVEKEKPVSCYSEMWEKIVSIIEERILIEGRKTGLIKCFNSIEDCVKHIKAELLRLN